MPITVALGRTAYRIAFRIFYAWIWLRPRERVGVKCVLLHEGRVLLVRHTYGFRAWDLPGGRIDRGESPAATAAREAAEELGLAGLRWSALGEHRYSGPRGREHVVLCFAARVDQLPLRPDRIEIAQAQWFWRQQLPEERSALIDPILALIGDPKPAAVRSACVSGPQPRDDPPAGTARPGTGPAGPAGTR